MDSTALSLCMDNDLPIYVFNMADERNIDRIVSGERVGHPGLVEARDGAGSGGAQLMSEMIDELLDDAKERMQKSVEATRNELATVRTGRASPHLLDRLDRRLLRRETPLQQLAQVAATDARMLTVTPYDKSSIGAIEKAVMESDLGLTPSNDGNVIRLQIPELTEERRKELVKVVHGVAEQGRVAVRNIRRDVMHDLRELKKEGEAARTRSTTARPSCRSRRTPRSGRSTPCSRARRRRSSRSRRAAGPASSPPMPADYVAIITDGNGRWAQQRDLPVIEGHRAGADVVKERLRDAVELGHQGAHGLLLLDRELDAAQGGGRGADGDVRRADRPRDPRARRGGGADALHRPPRGGHGGADRADGLGRGRDRRQRPDHAVRRLQLRRPGGDPGRGRRRTRAAGRRSSSATSTRPRCTTPTC